MVLPAIPDWRGAMAACVTALESGGVFVLSVNHPCFEELWPVWREHGEYHTRQYLVEYEIPGPSGVDFHRPLSTYLNMLADLGCRLVEVAEPGLPPQVAADGPGGSTPMSTCRTSSSSSPAGSPDQPGGHDNPSVGGNRQGEAAWTGPGTRCC
ncbi:MAG: hypothetical protein JXA67_00760 [Micromonosporaceae bacterium]|nr:hypothetical protein [Micromonosporaceae bacterium]